MLATFEQARDILTGEERIALDLETTGFSPFYSDIAVITLYGEKSGIPLVLHFPRGRVVPKKLLAWLSTFPEIVTHNGVGFDIMFLAANGMDWSKVKWYDTLVGECVCLVSGRRDLKRDLGSVVRRRTGRTINKDIDHGGWANETLNQEQMDYCEGDIQYLIRIQDEQRAKASHSSRMADCLEFEQSLIPLVIQMQLNGMPISMEALQSYVDRNEILAAEKTEFLNRELGGPLNLSSPKQLLTRLNQEFGEGVFPNTTAETIAERGRMGGRIGDVCRELLWFKQANKRATMYSAKWQREYIVQSAMGESRIHGTFRQIETETGRFSSRSPNLQQIPKDMRDVFATSPESGLVYGSTDYSAIEVRVAAALAPDDVMIQAFSDGLDIHTVVAEAGFGIPYAMVSAEMRQIAKALSFTLLFGGGVETFRAYAASGGNSLTLDQAQEAIVGFFTRFQGLARMRASAIWKCQNLPAVDVIFPTGLKRILVGAEKRPTVLLNNAVQGHAAGGLKFALALLWERGLGQYINAVVHDEIVYTAPASMIEEIRDQVEVAMIEGMERALAHAEFIPIAVESKWGPTWGTKEHIHTRESLPREVEAVA